MGFRLIRIFHFKKVKYEKEKFNEIYINTIANLKHELDSYNITRLKPFAYERLFSK